MPRAMNSRATAGEVPLLHFLYSSGDAPATRYRCTVFLCTNGTLREQDEIHDPATYRPPAFQGDTMTFSFSDDADASLSNKLTIDRRRFVCVRNIENHFSVVFNLGGVVAAVRLLEAPAEAINGHVATIMDWCKLNIGVA